VIELTTPFTQNGSGIGYPTLNDTAVKASVQTVDLDAKQIVLQIRSGTYSGNTFTPDVHLGIVGTLVINYTNTPYTCQATNVTGLNSTFNVPAGTSTTAINNMVTNTIASQAAVEGFIAVSGGLFPGTVVAG